MKKFLQKILPWLVALAILGWLFHQTPPGEILQALKHANIPLFLTYAILYFIAILLLDCVAIKWVVSRFATTVTYRETLWMRGVTYLLMIVNYSLGQGGMAFYLKRTHKAPVFKTLSAIAFLTMGELTLTATFAFLAVLAGDPLYLGHHLRPWIVRVCLIFYTALAGWIIFWFALDSRAGSFLIRIKIVEWITSRPLFHAFRKARLADYGILFSLSTLIMGVIISSTYLVLGILRCQLPLAVIYLYTPLILIIGTLPITPAGMGTVQAASIEFFKNHLHGPALEQGLSPPQIILTASLLWLFGNLSLKLIFGLFCLRKQSRKLFEEIE